MKVKEKDIRKEEITAYPEQTTFNTDDMSITYDEESEAE